MSENSTKTTQQLFRAPIVTVMGHVDHGKTSILDAIRKTAVQLGEYGGITQHVGAYQVTHNDKKITFIDTPGHYAFTQMRARGGKAADIVVLVVAADDGVQPQTKEALSHAKAANVPIIVAINKVDLPGKDTQKVKQQLASENLLVEDWGGEVISVEVSAKTSLNLDKLLEAILAVAELLELKYEPAAELEATIIETKKDKQKGVCVSAIVKSGTIKVGDKITASGKNAKVRSLINDKGKNITAADPGTPIEILGFKELPNVGDLILEEGSELATLSIDETRSQIIGQETKKVVSIVLRADTQGTLEAVKASLADIVTSSVGLTFSIKFLLTATGDITDSDVMLAQSGDGVVLGFNVNIPSSVKDTASDLGVVVKSYKTIYDLIDEVKDLLEGTALSEEKKVKGRALILKTFKLESGDIILGCKVEAGRLKVNSKLALYDKNPADLTSEDEPLFITTVKKLKIEKDDVDVVEKSKECGILLKTFYPDIQKGMWLEAL